MTSSHRSQHHTYHRSLTMKTLVVLSALAAVALAAPTQFEHGSEDVKKTITSVPEIYKRERKSLQEAINSESSAPAAPLNQLSTSHISEFGVSGRSFGLKKPIIIKKKPVGYQVYRDSDEVPADSEETCGSHVKVKFCDGKTKMKSTNIEDIDNTQITEDDMKHSITLAKEALETIERDLNIVERKPMIQSGSWNHGHSESDTELHQDIEVAREALEHIHKNFGNLESMSLHATTLKNTEDVPDAQFTLAKTEEQRLAQWKEAMNTIQKNVEIARNIEDSFREASGESGLSDAITMSNKHDLDKKIDHNLRNSEDGTVKTENKVGHETCKSEHAHVKSSEKENATGKLIEDDMASSASTMSENKLKDFENSDKTRHPSDLLSEIQTEQPLKEETPKEKNSDVDTMTLQDFSTGSLVSESIKAVEENKEEEVKNAAVTQSTNNVDASHKKMKSMESEDMLIEDQKKAATPTEALEKLETENNHDLKSAEHFDEQSNDKKKKEDSTHADLLTAPSEKVETAQFTKSAEEVTANTQQELLQEPKMQENMPQKENLDKHSAEAKMASNEEMKEHHEAGALLNHAEPIQQFAQHQQPFFHPEMRTTDDLKTMHQQQLMNQETRWAHDKNIPLQRESTNGVHPQTIDHVHTVQHPGHRHHVAHMKNHHFEIPSGHDQLHSRYSNNFMAQGKSADPDMQAYYMSMRDGSNMGPDSHRFRWKPTHESRTAYGAPAAPAAAGSSSGAVGLFPNANVGGCGIPLLLSCNPSVVSGSLAKPSPSYSAPAYRTEDDFNFHTKRDVKKIHENLPLHRTSKSNLKTGTVLVPKQ